MEPTKMWLTCRDVANRFQITYREALALASSGTFGGHWTRNGKSYRFNALDVQRGYEDGRLDKALNEIARG